MASTGRIDRIFAGMLLSEVSFYLGRGAGQGVKKLIFFACIFFCKIASAQPATPNCKTLNGYSRDGQAIRFVQPITIDSSADARYTLGIQANATYSYVIVTMLFKTAAPKVENDLVLQFTDQSSLVVPLTRCEELTAQGMQGYTCSFVVLDKYVPSLKTKTLSTVIIQLAETAFKSVDMKQHPAFFKDAVNCMGLISY